MRGKLQNFEVSGKDDRVGMEERRRRRRRAENERKDRGWVLVKCGVSCVPWR